MKKKEQQILRYDDAMRIWWVCEGHRTALKIGIIVMTRTEWLTDWRTDSMTYWSTDWHPLTRGKSHLEKAWWRTFIFDIFPLILDCRVTAKTRTHFGNWSLETVSLNWTHEWTRWLTWQLLPTKLPQELTKEKCKVLDWNILTWACIQEIIITPGRRKPRLLPLCEKLSVTAST